jgi:hypothetical protein
MIPGRDVAQKIEPREAPFTKPLRKDVDTHVLVALNL